LTLLNATDVVFFDESIDAKMNRYTFKLRSIDTPFLNNSEDNNYTKTYVAPTPDRSNIPPSLTYPEGLAKLKYVSCFRDLVNFHSFFIVLRYTPRHEIWHRRWIRVCPRQCCILRVSNEQAPRSMRLGQRLCQRWHAPTAPTWSHWDDWFVTLKVICSNLRERREQVFNRLLTSTAMLGTTQKGRHITAIKVQISVALIWEPSSKQFLTD
jgi:hypothetical protein